LLLDPSLPKSRITKMLADAQAQRVICDSNNEDFARSTVGDDIHPINCERLNSNIPVPSHWPSVRASDIAFIFYTSGSTGVPKGVVHHHRTMLHNVMLRTNSAHFCLHDRIALPRSGTSAAVANLLTATLNGAALYPFNFRKEGAARLARWFVQEEITSCTLSAPLFRSLGDVDNLPSFPHMRVVQFSSQAMLPSDVALYKKLFAPASVLINRLSTSETGPLTEYVMNHETVISENVIPVGYAQQDKQILLLDDEGNPLGFDQVGEIVVNSSYLSPGYWRNSNLTEVKFKGDPQDPTASLYHTGDMGLMRPDGCLVHMGRKDFRVKVRGYGVDISEIENVLRDHAGVKEAVVMLRGNNGQDDRLVAYLVPKGSSSLSVSDLRKYLKSRLPDYAVPSQLIAIKHFPLTPNGKIDRQALPHPGNARPDLDTPYSPPSTERELRLASLWAEALSVDQVGIHDNFFDLGGHSLAASRLITRLIDTFQLELPIKALFDAPTIADMAAIIAENQIKRATDADLDRMLSEIEAMTDDNAEKQLHRIDKGNGDKSTS
jgi:acyl-coenzyme A synthetase/AMP-(fatty) acid ligase/acyl carrier protein